MKLADSDETVGHGEPSSRSEHIDRSVLERLRDIGSASGRNVLASAIELYLEQTPALLEAARHAVAESDPEQLFRAAHNLRSGSANLGAVRLARTAAELEAAADTRRFPEAGNLLASIEAAIPAVCAELAALAGPEMSSKEPDVNADRSGAEILLVDDDPGFRLIASEALRDHGFSVSAADSATQAMERVEKQRPDLVVMDAIMPEMNGFDLCRRMLERDAEIPVLIVTALDDIHSVNQAFEAGSSGFTAKPVNFPVLIQQIRFVLRASHAEAELREQRCRLETAQRLGQLGYWRWSLSEKRFEMSGILKAMLCIEDDASIDGAEAIFEMVVEPDRERVRESLAAALDGEPQAAAEFQVMTACGDALDVRQVLQARYKAGQVDHVFGTIQDVSRERQAEAKIRKLAYFDELTGLASRTYFMQALEQTIRSVQRSSECFAVLFIDLDGFKDVNDSLGHDIGDELLRIVANRLRDALREGDFVARLGGDEFCVVARNVSDQYGIAHVAQRCIDESGQPVTLLSQQILPRMSIGIAQYPDDGRSATSLIKAADSAMYAAKHAGKNGYAFYSPEMTRQAEQRLALENDIRSALDSDQLVLNYQPQVSLATGRVVGVEALLRWNHPQQGTILPGEFIPIVERIGLIDKLGDFVIDRACAQIHRWHEDGVRPLNVSVNVSPLQLRSKTVAFAVAGALEEYGIDPSRLTLEVTETIDQSDSEALAVLERLNELGVTIAIDDFGTGYSSLGSLKYLPIQCLKIDRVFVRDMLRDADDTVLLGAIVGLARALELTVVVEGVDSYEQIQVLAGIGCEIAQGYFFSAPVTADKVPRLLDTVFLPVGDRVHTA